MGHITNEGLDTQDNKPLRVLIVEDNPDDAKLCMMLLQKTFNNIQSDIVSTPDQFYEHIRNCSYDVILADYALGGWTGLDALNTLIEENKDIPFILVTGALGEQRAVDCMKSGIADYVLKDRLDRLPIAISRALEGKAQRDRLDKATEALADREAKFRALAEAIPAATFVEQGTRSCYVNSAAERITGYSREELLNMNFWSLVLPDSRALLAEEAAKRLDSDESPGRYVIKILTKRQEVKWLDVTVGTFQLDGKLAALITGFDLPVPKYARRGTPFVSPSELSGGWVV
jgi:PAS domain S-box-containing protein